MNRTVSRKFDGAVSIAPQTLKNAANGTGVDLKGYDAATVVFQTGTVGDGNSDDVCVVDVQESSDNSSFTSVAAADLELAASEAMTIISGTVKRIGYKGTLRYIRAVATPISAADAPISAMVLRSKPDVTPVA